MKNLILNNKNVTEDVAFVQVLRIVKWVSYGTEKLLWKLG
jgi:hypothetical protein